VAEKRQFEQEKTLNSKCANISLSQQRGSPQFLLAREWSFAAIAFSGVSTVLARNKSCFERKRLTVSIPARYRLLRAIVSMLCLALSTSSTVCAQTSTRNSSGAFQIMLFIAGPGPLMTAHPHEMLIQSAPLAPASAAPVWRLIPGQDSLD
jgi:hypothetical protein